MGTLIFVHGTVKMMVIGGNYKITEEIVIEDLCGRDSDRKFV